MSQPLEPPQVFSVAALMGLCGGVSFVLISWPDAIDGWWLCSSAIGAAVAGALVHPVFGRPGGLGWIWSLFGMGLATLIGAALAVLMIGLYHFAPFAPLIVLVLIAHNAAALLLWLAFMAVIHLLVRDWREPICD